MREPYKLTDQEKKDGWVLLTPWHKTNDKDAIRGYKEATMKKSSLGIIRAVKYAYRHTWGSGRTGFLDALGDGMHIYNVYEEIIAIVAVATALTLAYYVGKISN